MIEMEVAALTMIDQSKLNGKPTSKNSGFDPTVYQRLPYILYEGCNVLTDPRGLGVISGMLPNVWGLYDGMTVYPTLFIYLLSPYGSGKGNLSHAKQLGMTVHREKRQITEQAKAEYELELEAYQADMKAWKKNKIGDPPRKPDEPNQYLQFIPANNSHSGFFELLDCNDGAGTMFETEGDTMAENIKKDNMNYSDGLRKAHHHEPISFYRRQNKEFVEVENPRLAVVLSSTFDQLLSLIPTVENGLFSRFLFYNLTPNPAFKNVFEPEKEKYQPTFSKLGEIMAGIYNYFRNDHEGFQFRLSPDQQLRFLDYFQNLKSEIQKDITTDLDGTVNRLGLQFFRIAMILTTLRQYGFGTIGRVMECSDNDFELTKAIIAPLISHAIDVYLRLPAPQQYNSKHVDKAESVKLAMELHKNGQTYSEISQHIFKDETHKSTVYRWIRNQ